MSTERDPHIQKLARAIDGLHSAKPNLFQEGVEALMNVESRLSRQPGEWQQPELQGGYTNVGDAYVEACEEVDALKTQNEALDRLLLERYAELAYVKACLGAGAPPPWGAVGVDVQDGWREHVRAEYELDVSEV